MIVILDNWSNDKFIIVYFIILHRRITILLKKMGASATARRSASLKRLFPNFHTEDWEKMQQDDISQRNGIYGNYHTYKNRINNEEIDQYELFFMTEKEKKIYEQCFMERLR